MISGFELLQYQRLREMKKNKGKSFIATKDLIHHKDAQPFPVISPISNLSKETTSLHEIFANQPATLVIACSKIAFASVTYYFLQLKQGYE